MNKDSELLTQVSIPVPCPADWSKMTGDERIRHCAQCKLNVYNISAMSTKEATELIREKEGQLCLRFYRRPDGTIITDNCPKVLKGTRDLIAKAAAAILAWSACVSFAEGASAAEPETTHPELQPVFEWEIRKNYFNRFPAAGQHGPTVNSAPEGQVFKTHRQQEPDSKHFNIRDNYFSKYSLGRNAPAKAETPVPESSSQAASDEETVDEASAPEVTDRPILLNEALLTFLALPAIILFLTFKALRKHKSGIWYVGLLLTVIFGLTGFFAI